MIFVIDEMQRQDWGRVRAIYAEGLETGIAGFMKSPPKWSAWDAAHLTLGRTVARNDEGNVIGWAALGPVPDT